MLINDSPYPNFSKTIKVEEIDFTSYLNFISFDQIIIDCNLDKNKNYSGIIESSPDVFEKIKISAANTEVSEEFLVDSWLGLVFNFILSENDLKTVPKFVMQSERFQKALRIYFPESLKKLTTKRPNTYIERSVIIDLDEYLIETIDEPMDVAVQRNVQILINHQNSDFSEIFTKVSRKRPDFKLLRATVWKEAIAIDVTFYFAYPKDLHISAPLILGSLDLTNSDNLKHLESLKFSPWLLNRRSGGIPKKIRFTKEMLRGYIKGWSFYVSSYPWQIYKQNGYGGRTYMSYAALNNLTLLKSIIRGFASNGGFENASYKMLYIPTFQFAVLLGYVGKKSFPDVRRRIREMRDVERRNYNKNAIDKAITEMLKQNELKILNEFYKCQSKTNKFGFNLI